VDAICKGLARSTGEIFNWLNSDDLLLPGALACIANGFGPATHMVAAGALVFGDDIDAHDVQPRGLTAPRLIRGDRGVRCVQPAMWLRRDLVATCGLDDSFHFFFDMELYIRYLAIFSEVTYRDAVVAGFRHHAGSKTVSQAAAFQVEYERALKKLENHPAGPGVRRRARWRLAELERHRELASLLDDEGTPRWRLALRLSKLTLARPRPAFLHMGAAALWRLARGRRWPVRLHS